MKETIEEQMRYLAQYAGGTCDLEVIPVEDVDSMLPTLMSKLQENADALGYDGFRGRPDGYPHIIWVMIFNSIVKPVVLAWIEENCPNAWFKLIYASNEEQADFMALQQASDVQLGQDMLDNPEDYGLI